MYRTIFLKNARNDIEKAALWYADKQYGLDTRFKDNVFLAIEKLQSDNYIHAPAYRGLCRIFVKKFPYAVYFRKDLSNNEIIIYGVIHNKQRRSILDER